jgi:aspartate/methionine/tyrosine aminotransferase
MTANYAHGNPETETLLAKRYGVKPENVFISSEGASGQNARIIRCIAEKTPEKNEAIVEYPTYEPLLRQVQEHFKKVKFIERKEQNDYALDVDELLKLVSKATGLFVLTNPHAPSGAVLDVKQLQEIMSAAKDKGFHVLCDEIYAEFNRKKVPTLFSTNSDWSIVTTGFTKAFGLGGLKLGIALASKQLVDEFYKDVLDTVGNSPNIVQIVATELLSKSQAKLEDHKQKWVPIKKQTEDWLMKKGLEFSPSIAGVTYWVKMPIDDTYKWTNDYTIPHYDLATVPGTFFLFKNDYTLRKSNRVRLSLGNVNPGESHLAEALELLGKSMKTDRQT